MPGLVRAQVWQETTAQRLKSDEIELQHVENVEIEFLFAFEGLLAEQNLWIISSWFETYRVAKSRIEYDWTLLVMLQRDVAGGRCSAALQKFWLQKDHVKFECKSILPSFQGPCCSRTAGLLVVRMLLEHSLDDPLEENRGFLFRPLSPQCCIVPWLKSSS